MESPVAARTVCSPTRFPWKAGHAARSILSRLGDAPSSQPEESIDSTLRQMYVSILERWFARVPERYCCPPLDREARGDVAWRLVYDRSCAPFSINDDVHVGSRHAGRGRGFWEHLEATGWPALPSPGGCNLLLRLPETFLPMSLWCQATFECLTCYH